MARLNIDWDAQPLGELPDERLANILGCSRGAVFHQRRKRNIAPWRPRHRVWTRSQARRWCFDRETGKDTTT